MSPEESLADLRHRLRTPLNHIIGYSELLLDEADEDAAVQLRSIKTNANLILSQIQHRLSADEDRTSSDKIADLRTALAEPLDSIIGTAVKLSQRLRGADLRDLLRITSASMDLFWFAQGNDMAGKVVGSPPHPPDAGESAEPAVPSRILVVDDDEGNCDVLSRQLSRSGHTVACVYSGAAALDSLREQTFDLVLLDVIMPGMSGFDVLGELKLKEDTGLSSLPVIMMSALDELESAARCIQMGAEDYLLKPLDPVLLRARIHSALERKRLHDKLNSANEDLHRFAFAASHDLQEPLRTVVSTLQMLEAELGDNRTAAETGLMELAVDAAKRMRSLISDLLAYSMASSQDRVVEMVSADTALDGALTNLRESLEESGATVTRTPLPEIPFDRVQLGQLFQNLVGNAIKYRGEQTPAIHVQACAAGEHWIFTIRDNGKGIERRFFQTIFEPFRRLHGRDLPGTGLGLAICERIVRGFGGRIWVESEPGKGSSFSFTAGRGLHDKS
jgi:signal transduction histidine kinase